MMSNDDLSCELFMSSQSLDSDDLLENDLLFVLNHSVESLQESLRSSVDV